MLSNVVRESYAWYSRVMSVVTIPKKLAKLPKGELVVIPRREYEALLTIKNTKADSGLTTVAALRKTVRMTAIQKKALQRSRRSFKKGKLLSFDEFSKKLGFRS